MIIKTICGIVFAVLWMAKGAITSWMKGTIAIK